MTLFPSRSKTLLLFVAFTFNGFNSNKAGRNQSDNTQASITPNAVMLPKSAMRIIAVIDNLGSKDLTALESDAKAYFKSLGSDNRLEAASPPLMFAHIGDRNMESMVKGSIYALVLISVLIFFALRSWRLG